LDGHLGFKNTLGQGCILLGNGWPLDFCTQHGCSTFKFKFEIRFR
jgi:hypothetical protein